MRRWNILAACAAFLGAALALSQQRTVTAAPAPQVQSAGRWPGRINTTTVRTYLPGSASFSHGTIAGNGGCSSRSIPVTGATVGDRVVVGPPAELLTYSLAMTYAVSAADTVTVRLCNYTNASITPPSWTWNVDVVKSF